MSSYVTERRWACDHRTPGKAVVPPSSPTQLHLLGRWSSSPSLTRSRILGVVLSCLGCAVRLVGA